MDRPTSRAEPSTALVGVVQDGEMIGTIGYACHASEEGHIRGMAVRSAWQDRGGAQQLVESAEAGLRSAGCARVSLDTTLRLERAMRFCERNGYALGRGRRLRRDAFAGIRQGPGAPARGGEPG